MVKKCRTAGVSVMVDAVINHMAGPFVFTPEVDRGKYCGGESDNKTFSTHKCQGWAYTEYGNRRFPNGRANVDNFDRKDFHHYQGNLDANCGLPPWTNNRHLCDLTGLPDLDTESKKVTEMIQMYLFDLYEIGVTMLRVDAAMLIYPESLAQIVEPFPWQYIVQEYYAGWLANPVDKEKAIRVGSVTSFNYGTRIGESLFDSGGGENPFKNRSYAFKEWLDMGYDPMPNCPYGVCDSAAPPGKDLLFVDNHDQQRERWKPEKHDSKTVCNWDGKNPGDCRPIYKHGNQYNLAQRFLLVWPYGDAVRLMSSYAWTEFNDGPPGVERDSRHTNTPSGVQCRDPPATSPVMPDWDNDTAVKWVCEHRWPGVLPLVRFRKLTMGIPGIEAHTKWFDESEDGNIGFSLGDVGFVALSRGYNWYTEAGSNASLDLAGKQTPLQPGSYCNLAAEKDILPEPQHWKHQCTGDQLAFVVDVNGTIVNGTLQNGGMVVLHANYTETSDSGVEDDGKVWIV